MGIETAKVLRI